MADTEKRKRALTQSEIQRVLSAAKNAGLDVSACIVKGHEIRVITKGSEALADTFDSVDFSS